MQIKPYVLLYCLLFFPFLLKSQFLVADINKSAFGSNPSFVSAGTNHFVFTAFSNQYGRELFISDGTETGTKLVKDLNPGNASSQFWEVSVVDTFCYFITDLNASTLQYWALNLKDPQHTPVLLQSLPVNGISSGQYGKFSKFGDQVYFVHRKNNGHSELWKTNGTPQGTARVFEFERFASPENFQVYQNQLIFLAEDSAGRNQLWRSDGTSAGTRLIKAVDAQFGTFEYVVYKDLIYFVANDNNSGWELWQTDATAEGTKLFADLAPGSNSSNPANLKVISNTLFFVATNDATSYELWRSEGTPQSTQLVKDIRPGALGSNPFNLLSLNNQLFFLADDGVHGIEPWKSDGTAEGTQLLKDIFPGIKGSFARTPFQSVINGGHLFFTAVDSLHGTALWRTDGNAAETSWVSNFSTGGNSSDPIELIIFKNQLYFRSQDGENGQELWKSDGTPEGTKIFILLAPSGSGSSPNQIKVVKNQLMFSARTETRGYELWKSDGTELGTRLVKDIFPGVENGDIILATVFKDQYVFSATHQLFTRYLWKSDGTEQGTVILKDHLGRGIISTERIAVLKDKLIFNAYTPEYGEEIWVSDGSEAGTQLLKDINPTGQSFPFIPLGPFILQDSLLFFLADDGLKGQQLWKTNGTTAGTLLVTNQPDLVAVGTILGKLNDKLFFTARTAAHGEELWISDGSNAGTQLVKDIAPSLAGSSPSYGIVLNQNLYFIANDFNHGLELWKSDGSTAGTVLLKDILPGSAGAVPFNLTTHQNELFFTVDDDGNGNGKEALWKTNGTEAGTVRVKQISSSRSFIRNLFSWGQYLYFSADDGVNGHELWRSDGTEAGTQMLFDLNQGSASSDPESFTPFKNDLYFSADNGVHGQELWRLLSGTVVSVDEPRMAEILVFPNPTIDQLVVRRNANNSKLVARLYDSSGRTVVQPTHLNEEFTELNVQALPGGIYFLEVKGIGSLERTMKKIVIVR